MYEFGFSYVGLIFLLMLFVPNILWTKRRPAGYDRIAENENRVLLALERAGEVLVCTFSLAFSGFNVRRTPWAAWLILALACMVLYEIFWIRYFRSPRELKDFYSSLLGVPVAGATLPVAAFFLLGIYGRNALLLVAVAILGVGHIGIHLQHRRDALGEGGPARGGRQSGRDDP